MNSSNSVSGPSPSIAPPTRSFLVLLTDGTRHRVTCRDLAVQLRQERTAELKRLRQARTEALARVADGVADARIRREFEAGERAMDAAIRRLSKRVRIKPEVQRRSSAERPSKSRPRSTGHSGLVLTNRPQGRSALARRDRLGREGIMLRIRYVRAGGKHAGPGCLRRHWRYIAREAAVTLDSDGKPIVQSNLGDTLEEVAEGLGIQEEVLRAMRKNAKLGFRMVGAFPYGLPVDARRDALQRIGDRVFGARGLPWSGAAHDADPGAKVDNPHFHLDYAPLPMERQADGSYIVSNDLRTDLDGQEGLRFIRHMVAQVMTEVAQEYGLERTFTALSYRERGMDREGGEHIGQEGTAAHRRGEHVASIERNDAKRQRDKARAKARTARERLEALEQLKRAVANGPQAETVPAAIEMVALMTGTPAMVAAPAINDIAATTPVRARSMSDVPSVTALPAAAPRVVSVPPILSIEDQEQPVPYRASPPAIHHVGQAPPVSRRPALFSVETAAPKVGAAPALTTIGIDAVPRLSAPIPTDIVAISVEAPRIGIHRSNLFECGGDAMIPSLALPPISAIAREARPASSVPTLVSIGVMAPSLPTPSVVVAIGDAAPRQLQLNLPHGVPTPAPQIDAPPAITAVGRHIATPVRVPQTISSIGKQVQRAPVAAPTIWAIGQVVTADAADEATAKRLRAVLELEDAKRCDAVTQGDSSALANAVHAAAFDALRLRDDWVGQDEQGHFTVSDAALHAAGLRRSDLATLAAQQALEAIGNEQVDRFDPVFDDLSGQAPFHFDRGAIQLDARFPIGLQNDVIRWSSDPQFRSFFAKVWPHLQANISPAPSRQVAVSTPELPAFAKPATMPADPWMDAAPVRQRAMADWNERGRRVALGMTQPGRMLARPGQDDAPAVDAPYSEDQRPARVHPGLIAQGSSVAG